MIYIYGFQRTKLTHRSVHLEIPCIGVPFVRTSHSRNVNSGRIAVNPEYAERDLPISVSSPKWSGIDSVVPEAHQEILKRSRTCTVNSRVCKLPSLGQHISNVLESPFLPLTILQIIFTQSPCTLNHLLKAMKSCTPKTHNLLKTTSPTTHCNGQSGRN